MNTQSLKTWLANLWFDITAFRTEPPGLFQAKNGLHYVKINKTSCDNEHCATVYHYWQYGQEENGAWVKMREVESVGEMERMK